MRTESDLRDAFTALADQAPDPAPFQQRLRSAPPPPRARRRPRPLVLIAVAACLALVAVLVPYVVLRQTTAPADLRARDYWGFVSRVNLPTGWVVDSRGIQDGREYTRLGPSLGQALVCEVILWPRGGYRGPLPVGEPVQVGARSGVFVTATDPDPGGLMWTYADGAWAIVTCTSESATDNRAWSELLARRVTFDREVAPIPARPRTLPAGYVVSSVVLSPQGGGTSDGVPTGGFMLTSPDHGSITVVASSTTFDPPGPGLPGVEQVTVRGYPTTIRRDQKALSMAVDGRYVLITGGESDTAAWAPGERDRLLGVADDLRFARDLADVSTWFDGRRLPQR